MPSLHVAPVAPSARLAGPAASSSRGTAAGARRAGSTLLLLLVIVLGLMPARSQAASATANFNVTATVLTSCSVTATDLAFGTYDAAATTDRLATSAISVTCSLLTPYNVGINNGTFSVSSTKRMGSGTSRLTYEIYRDVTMTNVFGTVAAASGYSGTGTGFAAPTTIYGKIPKNQAVAAGSYTDQITVTVDY